MLWDKEEGTIVNNESSEIIRMFNIAFNDQLPAEKAALDLYPEPLRKEIDEVNDWVYDTINSASSPLLPSPPHKRILMGWVDGVYKSGFASSQKAYEAAVNPLFDSLDRVEKMLKGKDYLIGNQLTEADIRLFVTIVRLVSVLFVWKNLTRPAGTL